MKEEATFWAVFGDMEDERPDAYFCSQEDAEAYLRLFSNPEYGDVLPMKLTWEEWCNVFSKARSVEE